MKNGRREFEPVTRAIVDAAYRLHVAVGCGLLESVYESLLFQSLSRDGLRVERQKVVSFEIDGLKFDNGFKVDLFVEESVVVELKSVEELAPIHGKQLLTYLRLMRLPVGLLINFGAPTFRQGIRRIVNNYNPFAPSAVPSHLRVK